MVATLLDGKAVAQSIRDGLRTEVAAWVAGGHEKPGLAVVIVGSDPASQVYVRNKVKSCLEIGMHSELHELPSDTSQDALMDLVLRLNRDPRIHGLLVQFPLPKGLDEGAIQRAISPDKDVDGLNPISVGRLWMGDEGLFPCTPLGCLELIRRTGVKLEGANAVVVGRSELVGKPVAQLLLRANCTVTICHSRTKDLKSVVERADIVVAAVGKVGLIDGSMVKPGAVVIDVGMNRGADGKLCGDVDFGSASQVAGWITPVPGGVGPMTIAMLLSNTLRAAKLAEPKMAPK
ncbi:MAG: bifunctional methylenetetrahydrofolate dehydrogenase/methenyltetrahydrofolate cyclohydrolase FolD [candidate division FCPU426 bacterium]